MLVNVLIVDNGVKEIFTSVNNLNDYEFTTSLDVKNVINKSLELLPNIIVLDILMQDIDGIEMCAELRSFNVLNNTAIIFYTSRDDDYAQIAAFNAGADDYIIKPVKASVMTRRINALIKRSIVNETDYSSTPPENTGLVVDRERYLVFNSGTKINLPRKEFELLSLLNSFPQKVFTRTEIAKKIWNEEFAPENRTIEVHIRRLREKLGKSFIGTIKGVGYKINLQQAD